MQEKGRIHIGTSGWHYNHWKGNFYPPGVTSKQFTDYYVRFFGTVEINNSFYRLPTAQTFAAWRESVPQDFLFAVKASRYITHMKKLIDPQQGLGQLLGNAQALEEKLGPILFQLPPAWRLNLGRFQDFLAALPPYHRYTFEFRDPSWYHPQVYELLRQENHAFCIYDLAGHQSPLEVTADFVYIRLHGPEGKYDGSYSEAALQTWASHCRHWAQAGKDVYIYFDNDINGHAPVNALRLQELVKEVLSSES
ncbi:DUF72 domain-containing protein [Rufibacter glacialis]|uniref:DUF72 domain-containing protein n=1 Tax=Rufibacter glacialis TaxID=1259555 RepID=A0A5M8QKR5_9BACT|nr:DUF72 domain-containing protein [Rufibacter glacialis]KAA6435574.1 DUF72 domain-containing protein [Rufibacter glacialis]GGK64697.1 hypothetical protein GCM10011405_10850 [Rufibacter glacialis]